ncbi:hypothetical protein SAMN05421823_101519 [Catalinimonas alkaloidigena]|uniref:Uncharacterized protein n=1 Tax=Catalinimonas alkaloidigena TaxID=1075417 RepID=A0A1G8Y170_9BACT|nr:hypothetical protein [Catalinimonas alkaloidigena]SDJ95770.1 hypothetical protein SAMN05421823_101519 [Catalinimonas alkaloidigena]
MLNKAVVMVLVWVVMATTIQAQTREIYTNPDFSSLAAEHQMLAIIPFKATVNLRPKQMEKLGAEGHKKLESEQGLAVQSALQTYFLKRKEKKAIAVNFQDITKTNALLAKNGVTEENIHSFTAEELAEMLGVDGIVGGLLQTDKPIFDGASIAMGMLVGYYGATNTGKCTIHINDGTTGELLWKYEKTLARSLGSDLNTIINTLMRKAGRKFPYDQLNDD